jgi:hypothetical protein
MRKWHRWVSLLSSIVMGFIAATGLLLQLDWYFGGRSPPTGLGGEPGGARPALVIPGSDAPIADAALARPPPPGPGEEAATTGWIKGYKSLHNLLQNLHAGYFMGTFGRWLSITMAVGLFALSITGIVMYVQLYSARARMGRSGFFWH